MIKPNEQSRPTVHGAKRAFIDIDTQVDFMDPAGSMYVPGVEAIVGALERLIAFAAAEGIPVLSSADDHPPDDPEFATWPPHCVHGTPGQRKIPATRLEPALIVDPEAPLPAPPERLIRDHAQLIFPKTTYDVFDHPHFGPLVDALAIQDYIVFGVTLDICVRRAARGLLQRGRRVTIIEDATRAINEEEERETRRELTDLGARWATAADVTAGRAGEG